MVLKLIDINKLQTCLFMYKLLHGNLPSCSDNFVPARIDQHYMLRTFNNLAILKYNLQIRERCITVRGPKYWNNIPEHLENNNSIALFKKNFRKFLNDSY